MKALYKGKLAPIKISFKYNVKSLIAKHNLVCTGFVKCLSLIQILLSYGFFSNLTRIKRWVL